jgi:UDP-galactopyranose mutase
MKGQIIISRYNEDLSWVKLLYKKEAEKLDNFIFGGRLAEYKYYDMHQIIGSALSKVKKELSNEIHKRIPKCKY